MPLSRIAIEPPTQSHSPDSPGHCDLVTALGFLLTDRSLLAKFALSPTKVADELNVELASRDVFLRLDAEQLETQAQTLLNKRWHEVAAMIPRTIQSLDEQAVDLFRFYANQYWPTGHRRHAQDAMMFLQFLIKNRMAKPVGRELAIVKKLASGRS